MPHQAIITHSSSFRSPRLVCRVSACMRAGNSVSANRYEIGMHVSYNTEATPDCTETIVFGLLSHNCGEG